MTNQNDLEAIELLVANSLGSGVLDAIDFPLTIRIPERSLDESSDAIDEAASSHPVPSKDKPSADNFVSELSESAEEAVLDAVRSYRNGTLDVSSIDKDQLDAIKTLSDQITDDNNIKAGILNGDKARVRNALEVLVSKGWFKFNVLWVKIVVNKPGLTLGNPISLNGMKITVQVKVEACVKILWKWVCATWTSPKVGLEARTARVELSGKGATVVGLPQFQDLDIVLKFTVLGHTFEIKIGVTTIVNNELKKKGPVEIVDLSGLEQEVPYSKKKIKLSQLSFPQNGAGLMIKGSVVIQ